MNPIFIACSVGPTLTIFRLRLDQGAHQQARLAYQIVSQVVNKRPALVVAVVAHGIRGSQFRSHRDFSVSQVSHAFLG